MKTGSFVNGIKGSRGVRNVYCSEQIAGSREYYEMEKKALDIDLVSPAGSPGLCIMPIADGAMLLSQTTYIPGTKVESRPHGYTHGHIVSNQQFDAELKEVLDHPIFDELFTKGPMDELVNYQKEGLLDYHSPEIADDQEEMSVFWRKMSEGRRWNFFVHVMLVLAKNEHILLNTLEYDSREVQAEMYRVLPMQYAHKLSTLSSGNCVQTTFHFLFHTEREYTDAELYTRWTMQDMTAEIKEYQFRKFPFLSRLVTSSDQSVRTAFFKSLYRNQGIGMADSHGHDLVADLESLNAAAYRYLKKTEGFTDKKQKQKAVKAELEEDLRKAVQDYYVCGDEKYDLMRLREKLIYQAGNSESFLNMVRPQLRKQLSGIDLYDAGKCQKRKFVRLALLTFEMTDKEYCNLRRNNQSIISMGPYYYTEFFRFLSDTSSSAREYKELVRIFAEIHNDFFGWQIGTRMTDRIVRDTAVQIYKLGGEG